MVGINRVVGIVALLAIGACDGGGRSPGPSTPGGGGGGTTPECVASNDACVGEEVCVGGRCESAYPRIYTAEIDEVAFQVMKRNSQDCWDAPCGAPDPYVVVKVNGQEVGRTSAAADSYFSSWSTRIDMNLVAGSKVEFMVYDEDVADDDLALNCIADPLDPDLLRSRAIGCGNRDIETSISISIEPKS